MNNQNEIATEVKKDMKTYKKRILSEEQREDNIQIVR